eukprot:CAMPEP_0114331806 /NCGR_PEP_ID=MMETSP0101-20121206/2664_1 /TAXON_ID=38822 ORGANISM="Pteridomonas danica, Strain PT" /NCGR_SAMPLE_ID=MMETSP0101 /ASSEMBLY_ACC=CAM_ASM_000211 /LENGTH=57 /DNA_ID=CAMNT_0001462275 /DNA_START=710 /DNA_END=883 /DNA_ORIENTATION=-
MTKKILKRMIDSHNNGRDFCEWLKEKEEEKGKDVLVSAESMGRLSAIGMIKVNAMYE